MEQLINSNTNTKGISFYDSATAMHTKAIELNDKLSHVKGRLNSIYIDDSREDVHDVIKEIFPIIDAVQDEIY